MNDTVKNIIKIILVVIVLAAQIFFGIKISDIDIDLGNVENKVENIDKNVKILEEMEITEQGELKVKD